MAINKNNPKIDGRSTSVKPKVSSQVKDSCRNVVMEGITLPPNMSKIANQKTEQDGINMSHKTK